MDVEEVKAMWWDDLEGWKLVHEEIRGHTRWSVSKRKVFVKESDPETKGLDEFYYVDMDVPATEYQDHQLVTGHGPAKAVTETKVVYVPA